MADNSTQTGADTIATDDIASGVAAGAKVQRVKLGQGADGTYADVSLAAPLHINVAGSGGFVSPTTQALTATGASTLAGTGSTSGSAVIDVSQAGNASFHLLAAAFVGTVVFEQSFDSAGANGTWASVPAIVEDGPNTPLSTLAISTAVAYVRQFSIPMLGPSLFRVRCSAFTSGSLTAYLKAGPGWYENAVVQARGGIPVAANVASSASSVTLLAANGNRLMARIFNDSASSLFVNETGATASATAFTQKIGPGQMYETPHPCHTSAITGIWTTATGAARVTEW